MLQPELAWVLDGFRVLCLTRQAGGFGPGPLGIGQMSQLLDELGITDRTTRLETIDHLLALDQVYLEWSQDGDRC